MKKSSMFNRTKRLGQLCGVAALALVFAGSSYGAANVKSDSAPAKMDESSRMVININDIRGFGDFDTERIRENLLRNAFYDAARRSDWVGKYDFKYNSNTDNQAPGSLEFTVLNWRRSHAGTYEFTVAANYWNADGEKVSLGTSHGTRLGLAVSGAWHAGDQFSASAEDAFRDSLRKYKEIVAES